jgi:hypothetical protein
VRGQRPGPGTDVLDTDRAAGETRGVEIARLADHPHVDQVVSPLAAGSEITTRLPMSLPFPLIEVQSVCDGAADIGVARRSTHRPYAI